MANIRLKELIEANIDPKLVARSKESGKLVYFKTPQAKDAALKAGSHLDPKAEKGGKSKADVKPNDMFGGDYSKDRSGMETVNTIASKTGLRTQAVAGWADENGINLAKVSDDLQSKKLNPMDFMTAVSGNPGNKYAKDIIAKYSQSVKQNTSVDGQTDDELYDALYDMGYDFGELGSDDFDEEGFADAAMNLGYRWDDKNKVWNHRDTMGDEAPKADTSKSNLPKKPSQLKYKHAETLETAINTETGLEGVADTDDNGSITYTASNGSMPTYTLYMGSNIDYGNPDEFRVSLESTYANDPADLSGKVDKTFKSADDAMKFMVDVAKKYKKELKMDIDDDVNESTKLTSMFKK
jgi:hypothetical protein